MPAQSVGPADRDRQIERLARQGMAWKRIAAEVGCHEQTVARICKRAGIPNPRSPARPRTSISAEQARQVERLARQGMAWKRIAAEVGRSDSAVARICKRAGIPNPNPRPSIGAEQARQVERLARQGMAWKRIAAEVGCTAATAARICKRAGIRTEYDRLARDRQIERLARQGRPRHQIAAEVGCTAKTVARICKRLGIPNPRPRSSLSAEQERQIERLARQGMAWKRIAAEVGCGNATVGRICKRLGIPNPRPRPSIDSISAEQARQIERLARQGTAWKQIATEVGFSEYLVGRICKRAGIPNPLSHTPRPSAEQARQIERLARQGLYRREIADEVGCTEYWVQRELESAGHGPALTIPNPEQARQIERLARQGLSATAIARQIDCSLAHAGQILRRIRARRAAGLDPTG